MSETLVLVSGFGPFEAFELNPSGEIARALEAAPPAGTSVRAAVLPVSFARAPESFDELLLAPLEMSTRPALYLGLGVARHAGFRLERFAQPELELVSRVDVDGRLPSEFTHAGPRLESGVDLVRLLDALLRRGVGDARISDTAGGYVCERIYHHLLTRARERGVPGLFVHVPPLHFAPLERQVEVVGWVIEEALALAASQSSASSRTSTG